MVWVTAVREGRPLGGCSVLVRSTAQTSFFINTLACNPDGGASEAGAEERCTLDPNHGLLTAGRTLLTFAWIEPFEQVDVPHAENGTTGWHSRPWAVRPIF
jgi:hypothetical protein